MSGSESEEAPLGDTVAAGAELKPDLTPPPMDEDRPKTPEPPSLVSPPVPRLSTKPHLCLEEEEEGSGGAGEDADGVVVQHRDNPNVTISVEPVSSSSGTLTFLSLGTLTEKGSNLKAKR